jgi:hypothetical protein
MPRQRITQRLTKGRCQENNTQRTPRSDSLREITETIPQLARQTRTPFSELERVPELRVQEGLLRVYQIVA